MDESRKQFEAWVNRRPLSKLIGFCERDGDGYMSLQHTQLWEAWQASRAAIEIELPSLKQIDTGERYVWSDGVFNFKLDAIEAIRAAGIKVKE